MGSSIKQVIHISDLDKTFTQGKVAKTLDRFKFGWRRLEEEVGEVKARHRSS
jgi:hypothetical protein